MPADLDRLRAALTEAARIASAGHPAGLPLFVRLEAELARAEAEESTAARIARIAQAADWQKSTHAGRGVA